MSAADPVYVADERRTAPAVREWSSGGRAVAQFKQDRVALARALWRLQTPKHEIAEAVGVHWAQVDQVLQGER